jgi:serine/threonine protein kinase
MNHLHSVGVLHRDLKLANILLHFPNLEGQVKPSHDEMNTDGEGRQKMTFDQIEEWLKKP